MRAFGFFSSGSQLFMRSIARTHLPFRIGDKKLKKLIDENPDADFILWNGSRPQIKRKVFEQFVDEKLSAI